MKIHGERIQFILVMQYSRVKNKNKTKQKDKKEKKNRRNRKEKREIPYYTIIPQPYRSVYFVPVLHLFHLFTSFTILFFFILCRSILHFIIFSFVAHEIIEVNELKYFKYATCIYVHVFEYFVQQIEMNILETHKCIQWATHLTISMCLNLLFSVNEDKYTNPLILFGVCLCMRVCVCVSVCLV